MSADTIILQTAPGSGIIVPGQSLRFTEAAQKPASASFLVIRRSSPPPRIADPHGLSKAEIGIALDALAELHRRRRRLLIVDIRPTHHGEREKRERIRRIRTIVGTYQKRLGLRCPEWLEFLECTPSLHAHLIVSTPTLQAGNELIDRLNVSESYREILAEWPKPHLGGIDGLVSNYLLKETTPQVAYGIVKRQEAGTWPAWGFHRKPNAKRGPPITGNRVRLSDSLRATAGPSRQTYASRSIDKLHEIASAALAPPPTPTWPPIQLGLPIAMPPPIDFRALAEAKRLEARLTQREAAARIGIRQPHWSNTIRGKRDAFSAWRLNRLREFVGELGRAA